MVSFPHRKLIVISGEKPEVLAFAKKLFLDVPFFEMDQKLASVLGKEFNHILYDAYDCFDPDVFAALSGAVIGGGSLVLLIPPIKDWAQRSLMLYQRVLVEGYALSDIKSHFIDRLSRLFHEDENVVVITELESEPPSLSVLADTKNKKIQKSLTADQTIVMQALASVISGHRNRPLVITADRGRGKSTLLGMAAAEAVLQGKTLVLVTGSNKASVSILLNQVAETLGVSFTDNRVLYKDAVVQYIPADEIIRNPIIADLLLVDEAASIALPMLKKLTQLYHRVAFATTVHGYEGSGHGFLLRFTKTLDQLTPNWKSITLKEPVRWREQDHLEQFVFNALLLNAEVDAKKVSEIIDLDKVIIKELAKSELVDNEKLLKKVFSLFVSAHYQTSPFDLVNMLDGPNIRIQMASYDGVLLGASWVAEEELSDTQLIKEIALGKRRPRGHLIPQTLIAQAGYSNMGLLKFERVVRIAVDPKLQRKGIGHLMLNWLVAKAKENNCDYIGSSFAAFDKTLNFWDKAGFSTVRIGMKRDASSGAHSVLLLKALNEKSQTSLSEIMLRFQQQLPVLLTEPLSELDINLVISLLKNNQSNVKLTAADQNDLDSFIHGNRQYEDAMFALEKATLHLLSVNILTKDDAALLIYKILQRKSWNEVVCLMDLTGKKQIVKKMREVFIHYSL